MSYIKVIKPGTTKTQLVEAEKIEFYKQYGWEPVVTEVAAVLKPAKKTAKPNPAVEQEVGNDIKGD